MSDITKLFIRFLKETGMYGKYIRRYYSKDYIFKSLSLFLEETGRTHYVIGAFAWMNSGESSFFFNIFNQLDKQWKSLQYEYEITPKSVRDKQRVKSMVDAWVKLFKEKTEDYVNKL